MARERATGTCLRWEPVELETSKTKSAPTKTVCAGFADPYAGKGTEKRVLSKVTKLRMSCCGRFAAGAVQVRQTLRATCLAAVTLWQLDCQE